MTNKFEIAKNPKILLSKEFDSNLIELDGVKLNEEFRKVNISDVVEVHVNDSKEEYLNFTKKIEQFDNHAGWIHMAGNFSFCIKNKKVDAILLKGKYLEQLKGYQYKDIISVFGTPDKILVDFLFDLWGDTEDAKILVYTKQKLYFFIDVKSLKVKEVHIGNINEKQYKPEDIDIVRKRHVTIKSRKKIIKCFLYSLLLLSSTLLLVKLYGYLL